jgi:hypothetical protein
VSRLRLCVGLGKLPRPNSKADVLLALANGLGLCTVLGSLSWARHGVVWSGVIVTVTVMDYSV